MKLSEARLKAGLKQKELAKEAKVSEGLITNVEGGKTFNHRPATMKRIAKALNCRPMDIDEFRQAILEPKPRKSPLPPRYSDGVAKRAMELRAQDYTYRAIAKELDISSGSVARSVVMRGQNNG